MIQCMLIDLILTLNCPMKLIERFYIIVKLNMQTIKVHCTCNIQKIFFPKRIVTVYEVTESFT